MCLTETVANTVYYRLRQVDASGEAAYSPVRTVQVPAVARAFKADVFPNPYQDVVTVRFTPAGTGAVTLTAHDMLGHILFTKTIAVGEGTQDIPLPQATVLQAGVYYLTVQQGNQQQVLKMSHQ
ncbi:T9SS type A sorting domain-containing protein [Hymenobacter jejuensis]|uniref:T9SS type A sorting domain-containing protein n=1 Tax=Hymenobacter jejuensis TaxID=2502781 RepID=A0A5B8A0L8_9BACT|nr:T9SS type A sorting domain-containing protein [Hymenobacter jejuensis]